MVNHPAPGNARDAIMLAVSVPLPKPLEASVKPPVFSIPIFKSPAIIP
nr:MAG TPA: hypothetical protein [Bacteriophage sp.]